MIQLSAKRCREEAALCCRRAERLVGDDRDTWLRLADKWDEMADRAEMLFSGMPETTLSKRDYDVPRP
jgi:hypothetical protein